MSMYSITTKKGARYTRGFSLVELMVALTIFAIVMTISIGTLLVMVDANAKAQSLYSTMTNMSFVVDSITRNIRTGYGHYCYKSMPGNGSQQGFDQSGGQDCEGTNNNAIVFSRMVDDKRMGYRLNQQKIEQKITPSGTWTPITGNDVKIERFVITMNGSAPYTQGNNTSQPVATLNIKGTVDNGHDAPTQFSLQSRVTRRILDY